MCKHCPPLFPGEDGYQDNRDPRDGTFEKFTLLPLEVQCAIFKQALPSPQVINLAFRTTEIRDQIARRIVRQLEISIPTNASMLPLLKACVTSQAEVYRNIEKIEVLRLGTNTPYALSNPVLAMPPRERNYQVTTYLRVSKEANTRSYTYMRADKDIAMINACDIVNLYAYGGAISMSNITRLALHNCALIWDSDVPQSMRSGFYWRCRQDTLFKLISMNCPALSELYFLLDGENYFHPESPPVDRQKLEFRIVEMDSEFKFQDFVSLDDAKNNMNWETAATSSIKAGASIIMNDWKLYLKAIEQKIAQDPAIVEFWKTREPVLSMAGWFIADNQSNFPLVPLPRMYLPSLLSWLPAHADGTIVDRYKGLAQIFDGAPW